MPTYERRRTFVEAVQWTGENLHEVEKFIGTTQITLHDTVLGIFVTKSNAICHLQKGDWIIAEPDGSGFYPCAQDVFYASYDLPAEKRSAP